MPGEIPEDGFAWLQLCDSVFDLSALGVQDVDQHHHHYQDDTQELTADHYCWFALLFFSDSNIGSTFVFDPGFLTFERLADNLPDIIFARHFSVYQTRAPPVIRFS